MWMEGQNRKKKCILVDKGTDHNVAELQPISDHYGQFLGLVSWGVIYLHRNRKSERTPE